MLLSRTWLKMCPRNLYQHHRHTQYPRYKQTTKPRPRKEEDEPLTSRSTDDKELESRNQYFTSHTATPKARTNTSASTSDDPAESVKVKVQARKLARLRARDELFAQLDRIQSQLTPNLPFVDPLNGHNDAQTDLLAMQNMFWHLDHPTPTSRYDPIRAAVRTIAQHNLIQADRNTMCMYCDGANFFWGAGAAVVVPRLRYTMLKRITRAEASLGGDSNGGSRDDPRDVDDVTSSATELYGLVLAMEAAAKFATSGQRVAVFCDAKGTVELNRSIWAESNGLGGEPQRRAFAAVQALRKRNVDMRVYWLAKNLVVPGSHLAHTCARKAAHKEPGEEIEVSERSWKLSLTSEAAEEARKAQQGRD